MRPVGNNRGGEAAIRMFAPNCCEGGEKLRSAVHVCLPVERIPWTEHRSAWLTCRQCSNACLEKTCRIVGVRTDLFDKKAPLETRVLEGGSRGLGVPDVADELKLSEKTINRRIKDGALRVHRLGRAVRIAREDLNAFVLRHRE